MNGCRQEALTINMARENAATPRRNTGGEDDKRKARSSTTHKRNKHQAGKASPKALALAGNSTPALTHTHAASSHTQCTRRRDTPPPHPVQSHRQRIRPQPAAGTERIRSKLSPKEPHAEADPHPSMTRRLTPCGHTECSISPIDLILRPSR
ncbi:hypothetical protein TcCL_ESM08478 [Trypanosoma cruzi]|nr:hypothetical protein TcCL_ESM08478 [Trypanosoma cruzi]